MVINECELNVSNLLADNKQQANFTFSFFRTILDIKQIPNVDDIYMNLSEKIEIYVFLKNESYEDENLISEKISEFEKSVLYFPELFIYSDDETPKMNVLPRSALRLC